MKNVVEIRQITADAKESLRRKQIREANEILTDVCELIEANARKGNNCTEFLIKQYIPKTIIDEYIVKQLLENGFECIASTDNFSCSTICSTVYGTIEVKW